MFLSVVDVSVNLKYGRGPQCQYPAIVCPNCQTEWHSFILLFLFVFAAVPANTAVNIYRLGLNKDPLSVFPKSPYNPMQNYLNLIGGCGYQQFNLSTVRGVVEKIGDMRASYHSTF